MRDKTEPDAGEASQLFVRPAKGDASRILQTLEAEGGQGLSQAGSSTVPTNAEVSGASGAAPERDTVPAARMRRRHWGLVLSGLLVVILPILVTAWYLWVVAEDQYGSVAGFTVRQDEGQGASELLGGIVALTGGSAAGDSDILYEFIQSQALIRQIDEDLDIQKHYSAVWDSDPVFGLEPGASIEDLEDYWGTIVRVSHDRGTGLLEVRVRAFTPEMAQAIASEIVSHSQDMINELNTQAREDALRFARTDLDEAVARLSEARGALTAFRSRSSILRLIFKGVWG